MLFGTGRGRVDDLYVAPGVVIYTTVCSGSVVVTAYDFESGRPGSNPECGPVA